MPEALKQLVGKTYQFVVCVEKENLWDGLDTFKVAKVMSNHNGLKEEHALEESDNNVNPSSIVLGDQVFIYQIVNL